MIVLETKNRGLQAAELERFALKARRAAGLKGTVSILISDNGRLKELNREFRQKNKPTDVLSFPAAKQFAGHAGELAISAEIAAQNAKRYGHSVEDEIKVLILHGMLHLAGHDHEADTGEMEALEARLRIRLGVADSLIERAGGVRRIPVRKSKAR
jgi:probable rRNA maturation factor